VDINVPDGTVLCTVYLRYLRDVSKRRRESRVSFEVTTKVHSQPVLILSSTSTQIQECSSRLASCAHVLLRFLRVLVVVRAHTHRTHARAHGSNGGRAGEGVDE
jgi:hypothetical protein